MSDWIEFRFCYSGRPSPSQLFEYKRNILLPVLRSREIEHFLLLDEPEFMLVRTPPSNGLGEELPSILDSSLAPIFTRITVERWSAIEDARNRILSSKMKLLNQPLPDDGQGWEVRGKNGQGQWVITPAGLDAEVEAFAKFMTHVSGKFTEAFISEMPSKVENIWLMSLFLHLMLDSVSIWQTEENLIREFPYF